MTIKGQIAEKLLKDYSEVTRVIIHEFMNNEIKKASSLGELPTKLLKSLQEYSIGKGIRGYLVVLGYILGGGKDVKEIQKISTFIEVAHAGILIQDDFMDRDTLRRGKPTIHKQFEEYGEKLNLSIPKNHYGNSLAVCLGDAAFYLSWKILLLGNFSCDLLIKASYICANYLARLPLGQSLDITTSSKKEVLEKEILDVIWLKSGEYTCLLPLEVGFALSGCEDEEKLKAIKEYAKCLGWAFQIQDDILGMFGDEKTLGKPIGSDLKEGKNNLLMLNLRKKGTKEQIEFQNKVLGKKDLSEKEIDEMRNILKDSGTYKYVIGMGWNYVSEGEKHVSQITEDINLQNILKSLLYFVMERIN